MIQILDAAAPVEYSGSEACRSCHPDEFARQSKSEHARALALAPASSPGHWVFGAGAKATTNVSQVAPDQYLEHGLTYYTATKSMAFTPGHTNSDGLKYRTFDPVATILRCFRCHSTGTLRVDAALSVQPVGGHLKTKFSEPGEGNIICAEGAKSICPVIIQPIESCIMTSKAGSRKEPRRRKRRGSRCGSLRQAPTWNLVLRCHEVIAVV